MPRTAWTPPLHLHGDNDRCRLTLAGVTSGSGSTLQEAANDLLVRLYDLALALRHGDVRPTSETGPLAPGIADFLWDIGDLAARGGDLRARVFGDHRSA